MITVQITAVAILLGLFWSILTQAGGLLQVVAQWVNTNVKNETLKAGLLCPYCLSGQISLWVSLYYICNTHDFTLLLSIPLSVNLTYLIHKNLYK